MKSRRFVVKRQTPGRLAQTIIGLLFGLIILQPTTVSAQVAVAVAQDNSITSIKKLIEATKQTIAQAKLVNTQDLSLAKQIAEYAKVAERWLKQVEFYTQQLAGDIRRFTTLKGILGFAEKQLGLDEDTLKALADIGEAIRGIFAIKNQFEALVRTRLSMLASIEYRARNGIFDPAADLQDLEDYLRNTIGRSAQNVIATRERLAQFDNELERWTYDLGRLRAKRATVELELKDIQAKLKAEAEKSTRPRSVGQNEDGSPQVMRPDGTRVSASAQAINNLTLRKDQLEAQLVLIDAEIAKLVEKITARYKEYHQVFDVSKITAEKWREAMDAYDKFAELKDKTLDKTIDNYGKDQPALVK